MIKYQLSCDFGCQFEAWFRDSHAFDVQAASQQIECPQCGSTEIAKSVMAPQISRRKVEPSTATQQSDIDRAARDQEIEDVLRRFREDVEARADYVGDKFAEEARKMHFNEKPKRDIWGEATVKEVRDLIEDDVTIAPLPRNPDESN